MVENFGRTGEIFPVRRRKPALFAGRNGKKAANLGILTEFIHEILFFSVSGIDFQ